ncbi:MAG: hypothetical protein RLZZ450_2803 [Pseudomonadota bacterium]|jgi:TPR repeat protein
MSAVRLTPRAVCAATLALLTGCASVVRSDLGIISGSPRVISRGAMQPVSSHILADASWRDTPGSGRAFALTAAVERTCESVQTIEHSQAHVVRRWPNSMPRLLLDYAIGLAGLSLLGLAAYQHFGQGKEFEEPAPTAMDPKHKEATGLATLFVGGAGMTAALISAISVSVRSRDLVTALPPERKETFVRQPCEPPRPVANSKIELHTGGYRYAFTTDTQGRAERDAKTIHNSAAREQSRTLADVLEDGGSAYVDGIAHPELDRLAAQLAAGLRGGQDGLEARCRGGQYTACSELGDAYVNGRDVTRDLAQAAVWFERACSGGDAFGCFELGRALSLGLGVERDPAGAIVPLQQACEHGEPRACTTLGYQLQHGEGIVADQKRALSLYERACNENDPVACYNLARQFVLGRGVPRSTARAVVLYTKACEGGMAPSCHNLALMFASGQGIARDEARAAELFKKACTDGYAESCTATLGER